MISLKDFLKTHLHVSMVRSSTKTLYQPAIPMGKKVQFRLVFFSFAWLWTRLRFPAELPGCREPRSRGLGGGRKPPGRGERGRPGGGAMTRAHYCLRSIRTRC